VNKTAVISAHADCAVRV